MLCQNCNKREETENWVGDGGTLAFIRGYTEKWCKICCLEAQLKHAKERADAIPHIEKELNELLSKEKNIEDICEKAENKKHCWHTGNGIDSASINTFKVEPITNYMCCWCGKIKADSQSRNNDIFIPHGKYKWINFNMPIPITHTPSIINNSAIIQITTEELCLIEEFFRNNPNETSCFISCPCSRHRVIC